MIELGRLNTLTVMRIVEFGVYLEGGDKGGILLPQKEVPEECQIGDRLRVFVYLDSDDMPVATMKKPRAQVGEFASLVVADTNQVGAFLDWGLPKQLFLPFAQQAKPVEPGQRCIVYLYIDNSGRIAASAKLEKFLDKTPCDYPSGQAVELLFWRRTDLGYLAIVDHRYLGMLHNQDLFREIRSGMIVHGYIKQAREDGKIDVMLEKPGYAKVDPLAQQILQYLELKGGQCQLNDKSSPEEIRELFAVSKKAFKMALGNLMKQGLIRQSEQGIERVE